MSANSTPGRGAHTARVGGSVLAALIVVATALFVVGVSVERGNEPSRHVESGEAAPSSTESQETGEEPHSEAPARAAESGEELRPLGIDVEAWPFVALAALASLALAAAAWLRPRFGGLLALVALAMLLFGVLDVREVFHQADIDETVLAVLAGVVAALHLAAGAVAARMAIKKPWTMRSVG